jgi:hypothetical protein
LGIFIKAGKTGTKGKTMIVNSSLHFLDDSHPPTVKVDVINPEAGSHCVKLGEYPTEMTLFFSSLDSLLFFSDELAKQTLAVRIQAEARRLRDQQEQPQEAAAA